MKKIVSIISIFAIILSATQFVLADYSDDTTITDGQFAYKKGTNNILAYVGTCLLYTSPSPRDTR